MSYGKGKTEEVDHDEQLRIVTQAMAIGGIGEPLPPSTSLNVDGQLAYQKPVTQYDYVSNKNNIHNDQNSAQNKKKNIDNETKPLIPQPPKSTCCIIL